jgi:hypothetical protein
MYSLFEMQNRKWVRISESKMTLRSARIVFQGALLAPIFEGTPERCLKVVKK